MERLGVPASNPLREVPRAALTETTQNYDLLVYISSRLPMRSSATRSYLVVQFPRDPLTLASSVKHARASYHEPHCYRALSGYTCLTCSDYTRNWIRTRWRTDATVLYPPVVLPPDSPADTAYKRIIFSVGRFFVVGGGSVTMS